eukprot:6913273-Prymnesium_polylepis.1
MAPEFGHMLATWTVRREVHVVHSRPRTGARHASLLWRWGGGARTGVYAHGGTTGPLVGAMAH